MASFTVITANYRSSGKARRKTWNGRTYLVADMTLIVPGVLEGSSGPLYYPEDEVRTSAPIWDMQPLVLGHPRVNNKFVSAKSPGVFDQFGLGYVRKPAYSNRLQAQGWFDEEYTKNKAPEVYARLERGEPVEISTGLETNNVPARNGSRDHKGRPYTHIARDYRADHVAVLPNAQGACSINDGCGVFNQRILQVSNGTVTKRPLAAAGVTRNSRLLWTAGDEPDTTLNCGGPGSGRPGPCPGLGGSGGSGSFPDKIRDLYERAGKEHKTMKIEDIEAALEPIKKMGVADRKQLLAKMELRGFDRKSGAVVHAAIRQKILDRRSGAQRAAMIFDESGFDDNLSFNSRRSDGGRNVSESNSTDGAASERGLLRKLGDFITNLLGGGTNNAHESLEAKLAAIRQSFEEEHSRPRYDPYTGERLPDVPHCYLRAVYDDWVIYEEAGALYRQEYSFADDVIDWADPVEVEVEYVPRGEGETVANLLTNADPDPDDDDEDDEDSDVDDGQEHVVNVLVTNQQPDPTTPPENQTMKLTPEAKKEIVANLQANCSCGGADMPWKGQTAEALNAKSDDELYTMEQCRKAVLMSKNIPARNEASQPAVIDEAVINQIVDKVAAKVAPPKVEPPVPITANQMGSEEQEDLAIFRTFKQQQKAALIERLTANVSDPAKKAEKAKVLNEKRLAELIDLADLFPAAPAEPQASPQVVNFLGAAGTPPMPPVTQKPLPKVTYNWSEKAQKQPA